MLENFGLRLGKKVREWGHDPEDLTKRIYTPKGDEIKMPYTRTWSEELVAEWLQLEGYFIEVSVPIGVTPRGGRFEADIIGIRLKGQTLEIMHVETGNLTGSATANIESILDKFTDQKQNAIINYCREKLGFSGKVSCNNLYVATYVSNKTLPLAKKTTINLKRMEDFIQQDVASSIHRWKANPPTGSKTRGSMITLPDGLWLLHLVDYISLQNI